MHTLSRRSFLAASAGTTAATFLAPQVGVAAAPARKFQLGLVTYNVPAKWDLPTILKVCKEVGIAAVECRTTHKHGVEPSLNASQRKVVRAQFADSGVVFWGCGSVCEFHSDKATVVRKNIEECKRFIDLVKDLGGKGVKVRPNGVPRGADPQKTFEQIGQALIECGKAAASAGLEIWVEVHGPVTAIPKNIRAIMDACGHPAVGVTWNSNGSDLDSHKSLDAAFALLKPFLRSCHINDLENDKKGIYPYRELFRHFREVGYDRYTLCECAESKEPERFLRNYKALWRELNRA